LPEAKSSKVVTLLAFADSTGPILIRIGMLPVDDRPRQIWFGLHEFRQFAKYFAHGVRRSSLAVHASNLHEHDARRLPEKTVMQ